MNDKEIAKEIVLSIVKDLSDISGLGDEWEQIESGIQLDIITDWAQIVKKILDSNNDE